LEAGVAPEGLRPIKMLLKKILPLQSLLGRHELHLQQKADLLRVMEK
jgi:hypothetical protein